MNTAPYIGAKVTSSSTDQPVMQHYDNQSIMQLNSDRSILSAKKSGTSHNRAPQSPVNHSLHALTAKHITFEDEQSSDGCDHATPTKPIPEMLLLPIEGRGRMAFLTDMSSLSSSSDVADWSSLESTPNIITIEDEQAKIDFYQENSKINMDRAISEYQQNFYKRIQLKHYLALCNYFSGDYAIINAYNRGEISADQQRYAIVQTLSRDLDQAIDALYRMNCTVKDGTKLYRVVVLPNQVVQTLCAGEHYRPKQVLSVSKGYQRILNSSYFSEKSISKHHQNVLFIIEKSAQHAVDIQNFSSYSEKEALFARISVFKIIKTKQNGDFYQVNMCYEGREA